MSGSTLDILSGILTQDVLRTAVKATGESQEGLTAAFKAAIPVLLGGLAQNARNGSLMDSVADMARNPAIGDLLGGSGGILSQIGPMLTPGASTGIVGTIATTLLEMLFGKNVGKLVDMISSMAGLRYGTTAGSLLKLAAPMVLAAIAKRLGMGNITGSALGTLLGKEKDGIFAAIPGPMAGAMGLLSGMGATGGAGGNASVMTPAGMVGVAAAAADRAHAGGAAAYGDEGGGGWLGGSVLGLLITGAILAGIVFGITQCNRKEHAAMPKAEAPAPAPTPAAVAVKPAPAPAPAPAPEPAKAASILDTMTPGQNGLMMLALPGGTTIAIAKDGVESKLIGFLEDTTREISKTTWFDFDRLHYKTASSELTEESRAQVEAVAGVLKAYPTAEIKIGGYTDNQGNPDFNLDLSDKRAKSVMQALVDLGIPAERLDAEGYGEQHAVGDNATPEGRAMNRRTALSVRKR